MSLGRLMCPMGNTVINGSITLADGREIHYSIDGKLRSIVSAAGGVNTYTDTVRNPDRHIMVLFNILASEATAIAALTPNTGITLQSDGFGGTVNVTFDFFEANMSSASGRGVGILHYH